MPCYEDRQRNGDGQRQQPEDHDHAEIHLENVGGLRAHRLHHTDLPHVLREQRRDRVDDQEGGQEEGEATQHTQNGRDGPELGIER